MTDSALTATKRAFPNPLLVTIRLLFIMVFLAWIWMRHVAQYYLRDEASRMRLGHESSGLFFRGCLRIVGIRVTVEGTVPQGSVLFTPNHISYLDILAVGASCPTFFVSKVSVAHWPVVGYFFRLSKSLTINRKNMRAVRDVNEQIADRIMHGNSVCVFLEGTTSNGQGLLPFHASLLESVVKNGGGAVPVAIEWHTKNTRVDIQRDVAYWKNHVIGPHAYRVLGLTGIEVTLKFGDPVYPEPGQDRKAFANALRMKVLSMMDLDS